MPRDSRVYLEDILAATGRIRSYVSGLSQDAFAGDVLRQDGVIRNLEVIGEAVKNLPEAMRSRHPAIHWRKIAGLRDVLSHAYFDVDLDIVWDVVQNKLGPLEEEVRKMLGPDR